LITAKNQKSAYQERCIFPKSGNSTTDDILRRRRKSAVSDAHSRLEVALPDRHLSLQGAVHSMNPALIASEKHTIIYNWPIPQAWNAIDATKN